MAVWILCLSLILSIPISSALSPDGQALLQLKKGFNNTKHMLRSWRETDPNPCGWSGVTCHLPNLRVRSINLPYLQLGGIISPSIGKLHRLQRLALHQNSLHGSIPAEIRNCTELRALYLRANYLQDHIPPELGELAHLTVLDLSSNLLRGTIPPSIGRLTRLRFLNLSTNFFSGEIPKVGVLGTFRNTSFVGNLELCGLPIQKFCRRSLGFPAVLPHPLASSSPVEASELQSIPTRPTSHFLDGLMIGAVSSMGVTLLVILGLLWVCLLSRKGKMVEKYMKVDQQLAQDACTRLITFRGDLPYSSQEIIEKLELLDEEDIVGSGGFGVVYKMTMEDLTSFAVKRIDRHGDYCDQEFERELGILGSIKHINLVNLRGYCRLPSTKLLIYDYLPLGSLDHYLHDGSPLHWHFF